MRCGPVFPGQLAKAAVALLFVIIFLAPARLPLLFAQSGVPPGEAAAPDLSKMPKVFVRQFTFEGNTVFSSGELSKIAAPYENREITSEEVQAFRRQVTQFYVDKGYATSGAVIPDQKVTGGVIVLRIIEGRFSEVELEGNRRLRSRYILDRLGVSPGTIVNVNALQRALSILQQNPHIKRINAELRPGVRTGESSLKISVTEACPYRASLEFSNNRPPSIGAHAVSLHLADTSLTGHGDQLSADVGFPLGSDMDDNITRGRISCDLNYSYPLTAKDTTLRLEFRKNDDIVIEEPFTNLNIEGISETYGIGVAHPFYREVGREFTMGILGEYRHSETYLLGRLFPFTGAGTGETEITVFRWFQEYTQQGLRQVSALRSTLSLGSNPFGLTETHGEEGGTFFSWLGQLQSLWRLTEEDLQLVYRTDAQLANDHLLSLERFPVGGMDSVRGYRENRLVHDNGVASSVELRVPIVKNRARETRLYLCPFVDWGASWNTDAPTPKPCSIWSFGFGFRWTVTDRISAQIYLGIPMVDFHDVDKDVQDFGVHYRVLGVLF